MKECPVCCRCFPDQVNHCSSDGESLKHTLRGDTVLDERYQLEKRLGQGGMGIVYKARHVFLKTQHAIKVILPDLVGNDPSLATRFRQEAMAAAAIQHPNTVSVTDYGVINDTTPFLVMELVEGRSLHDILLVEGKLPPALALDIMLAVCSGVGAAHKQEIIHRDLKPLNILLKNGLAPGEGVKVLDFGLAKIKSGELLGSFVAAQTQGMMGSPYYMAPEQWGDEDVDRRADIYSLGVILYQMLAGEVPFKGNSVPSIMNKHLTTPPKPFSERGVAVPPELEQAVRHALEKDVSARPQTIQEFMAELRKAAAAIRASADTQAGSVGLQTIQMPPVDTLGAGVDRETAAGEGSEWQATSGGQQGQGAEAEVRVPSSPGLSGDAETSLRTDEVEEEQRPPVVSPVAGSRVTKPLADAMLSDGSLPRGADTARQRAEATGLHPGGTDDEAAKTSRSESPTALLDREEEAHLREEEDRRLREAEEQRRKREESERAASQQPAVGAGAGAYDTVHAPPQPEPSPRTPLVVAAAVVALLLLGGVVVLAYFVVPTIIAGISKANTNANANVNTEANANSNAGTNINANTDARPTPEVFKPDLVSLPGGTYRMGRADVPPVSDRFSRAYLLWLYSQWPAHTVSVGRFEMDRTEVTNAEYAAFVSETGHPAPPGWDGIQPKEGGERLPVSNVSYEDVEKFAAWRSRRDSVDYRLPTEEEWEYAARGGTAARAYPWGDEWSEGRANLNSDAPKPVGSFPRGRTPQGLDDMIGNVWEWTSSTAAMYNGNDRTRLEDGDRGKIVVRGGSYASTHDGDEPITVTSRRWVAKDSYAPVLGFRLVRAAP